MSAEFDFNAAFRSSIRDLINDRYRQALAEPRGIGDVFADIAEWQERFGPPVYRYRASRRVPRGRVFRQWDTRGRLHVWANTDTAREVVEQLVRERAEKRAKRQNRLFPDIAEDFIDGIWAPAFHIEDDESGAA